MSGKPIRVSPYSHDPFAHLTMTDEELEELYSNRDSDFSRPYTVTDVITRVYNRSFRDDFVSSFESDPSLFNTLAKNGESMEIVKYWINEFCQSGIEAVYSLTDHKCPVDVVYKVRIKAQVRVLQHAETLQYCNISATVRLRYLFDFVPCCLTCDYLSVILDEKMSVCGMNPEAIRLDKYLLSLLMKDKDYEKFSQDIIKKYLPKYLNSAEPISGMEWLQNMGLKVHYGRFPDKSIMGEYFIRCGTALIYDIECSKSIKGYLNPGAIVINEESCETEGMVNTTCTHEGVHHCGGWFFFMLQMCHGKNTTSYVINHLTHSVTINRGEHEQILIEDHHEAIVDRELFQRVQEKRQRRFMGAKFIQYPFGSLPKCPYCGEVLHRRRCLYRDLNGVWICDDENCGRFAVLSKDLEQAAVNAYNASNQEVGEITQAEKWWVDQLVESFTIEDTSLTVHWKNGESNRVEIPIDKETPEYILEKERSFKIRHGMDV